MEGEPSQRDVIRGLTSVDEAALRLDRNQTSDVCRIT